MLTDALSLQLGFFTDLSAVPDAGIQALDQTDFYGGTASLTHRGEKSVVTGGLAGRYGTGTSYAVHVVRAVPQFTTTDVRQWSVTVFVSGSTTAFDDSDDDGGLPSILP